MHEECIRNLLKRRVACMGHGAERTFHIAHAKSLGQERVFFVFLDTSRAYPADNYRSVFYESSIILVSMRNIKISNMWFSAPFPVSAWQNARSSARVICGSYEVQSCLSCSLTLPSRSILLGAREVIMFSVDWNIFIRHVHFIVQSQIWGEQVPSYKYF